MDIPGPGGSKPIYSKSEEWKSTGSADIMVFRPTIEEFKDFNGYIKKIEESRAHIVSGICKVHFILLYVSKNELRPSKSSFGMKA